MASGESLAAGTGTSVVVTRCQICGSSELQSVLFLGFLPPVNQMRPVGMPPTEQTAYPARWLYCPICQLVQIGLIVDPQILFPPEYPYTSGSTKVLRDNFAEMYAEARGIVSLNSDDLVVDIGSNDGTLLANFKQGGQRVRGVEPSQVGRLANQRDIPTLISFFDKNVAEKLRREEGWATIVTATNVFAHIENVHDLVQAILTILKSDGVFISESHYLMALLEALQYDTIYHEHLRYYSVNSIRHLLDMHGLEIIHVKRIPTHGGSIRVYAARKGARAVRETVGEHLALENSAGIQGELRAFKQRVMESKLNLHALLAGIRNKGERVYGIGAPSRASTLINYVGLDDAILDCVLEVNGSLKIGKYMPGTIIPVVEEACLYKDQPEYVLLLSWHIAEELIANLKSKGFLGKYIVPLPEPRVITHDGESVQSSVI